MLLGRDPTDKTGSCAARDVDDLMKSLPVYLELPLINVGVSSGWSYPTRKRVVLGPYWYYDRQPESGDTI